MGRIKTSLELFESSWSVMKKNKTLLFFPVIVLVFILMIMIFFLSSVVLLDTGDMLPEIINARNWPGMADRVTFLTANYKLAFSVIGAGVYLIAVFLATFFNVAFYNEILHALNGNSVSIARGIGAAWSKIKLILIWSLFAGLVGMIIKTLEERLSFVGRWIMTFIGFSWSVASVFIVPVIIREEKTSNPVRLLKTSASMLHRTWGEAVTGYVGFSSLFLIGLLVIVPLFIIALIFAGQVISNLWVIIAMLLLIFISLLAFGCLYSVMAHIYRCALYVYATEGIIPGPYDEEMMNMCWKVKR